MYLYNTHTYIYIYIYISKCTYQNCTHVYHRCISGLMTTSKWYAQLHIARINSLLELHFATTTICESSRLRMAKSLNAKTLQNSFYCAGFLALLMLPSFTHNQSICGFLICGSPKFGGTIITRWGSMYRFVCGKLASWDREINVTRSFNVSTGTCHRAIPSGSVNVIWIISCDRNVQVPTHPLQRRLDVLRTPHTCLPVRISIESTTINTSPSQCLK